METESFWMRNRRRICLRPGTTNLNAGTLSPTPRPVLAEVTRLRRLQAGNPSDFLWRQTPPLLADSRAALGRYVNADAGDLLLLPNVTWGINLVAAGLDLPRGSEILTSDHEYGAMNFTWQRLAQARGWRIRRIELPYRAERPAEIVRAFEAGFTARTRVLFFSHVTSTTGLVLPARELCRLARRSGALSVIDGAHAPGMVVVDLHDIRADFYAANCHKWMMAPACCGFLHVRHDLRPILQPAITSWGWGYNPADIDKPAFPGGNLWQGNLEFHGCEDRCPQMALGSVLEFRRSLGGEQAIAARCRGLADYARARLGELGLVQANPANPALTGSLAALEFPSAHQAPPDGWLWKNHRIECPVTRSGSRAFLRVSAAWFVTRRDIDRLVRAMRAWMKR